MNVRIKRIYSYTYLINRYGSPRLLHEWAVKRCAELSKQTGAPWTHYTSGSTLRVEFSPYINSEIHDKPDEQLMERIIITAKEIGKNRFLGTVNFGELWESMSDVELLDLLSCIKAYSRGNERKIHLYVNRQGRPTMFVIQKGIK